ncbi:sensor histidine kinase [Christensenella timonensis]|uniref:sensor histidine kinase n=1 Tax=Christensenella timonensis TaxID=1816678 RepID=UPI00082BACD5|nr:ATP-binding protein [Christensenella timonensis]
MKKKIVLFMTCMLVVALVVTVFVSTFSFRGTYANDMVDVLKGNVNAIALAVGDEQSPDYQTIADKYQQAYGQNNRVTFIAPDGSVLADAPEGDEPLQNHLDRPEIKEAINGSFGYEVRYSQTKGYEMVYVAKQLPDGVIVRNAMPLANVGNIINQTLPVIIMMFIVLVVIAVIFSGRFAQSILRPFGRLYESIQAYVGGKSKKLEVQSAYPEFEDITRAFTRLAQRLNRYIERVKAENKKTSLIIDSLSEGLLIVDEKMDVLLINAAAKEILGAGEDVGSENILHFIRRQDVVKKLEKSMAQKKNKRFEVRDELNNRVYRFYTSIVADSSFAGSNGYGMLVLISDVTDIEKSERIRRDFAANVSHELKTPLTSINGFAQLIENGMVDDPQKTAEYAKRITEESDRLMGLINDTLQLSELEQITIDESVESVELETIAQDVLHLLENKIQKGGIETGVEGHAEIRANKARMKELILNLCDNAVKYSQRGGHVTIRLEEDAENAYIHVRDDGIGIPEEEADRIFERFYRAKNSGAGAVSGTGLGLAIAKHITSLYDGELTVVSELGKGSEFTARLKKE